MSSGKVRSSQRPRLKTHESLHKHWSSPSDGAASGSYFLSFMYGLILFLPAKHFLYYF